ncbi:putative purine permease [Heracleum sosnowskyi]|uniref:Probable purine permease n=1 Tax=Heracleum sosnowskyi TaxID=360622 RepID=A0AAD8HKJ1_9APIA|nr:putative purine permease [Heracleum sosnowskyi]
MGKVDEECITGPSSIMAQEAKPAVPSENTSARKNVQPGFSLKRYSWWIQMIVYSIFVLSGQSVATLLGRLYYEKGGNSKWMATLVQTIGFPVLVPFIFLVSNQKQPAEETNRRKYSPVLLVSLFIFLGVFLAADCMLYSIGLLYLPVSTYTLVCASQLGFNAFFSYFLNAQKLTPFIINSLILLTISSVLLVFSPDSSDSSSTKGKYAIGFICTLGASAGYALMLSVTQLAFRKVLRNSSIRMVVKLIIYQSAIATVVILIGLFASGEWKSLTKEMQNFKLGNLSYLMTLVWISVSWQIFNVGAVGLIYKISSLFSNVISALGLPIVPVLSVFIFNDKMNGVKVVSMVLAIWGFVSYIYQHYIDDLEIKAKAENANKVSDERNGNQVSEIPLMER